MKTRRDDRIASIQFGPEPYFEIFCDEEKELRVGERFDGLGCFVVAHGLVSTKALDRLEQLQRDRITDVAARLELLRVYRNRYNAGDFVALLGFVDEPAFHRVRGVGDFLVEEYLFTGLRKPLGMSYLAGYNQFVCAPLSLTSPR